LRTIAALLEAGCRPEVVFSEYGRRLLMDEIGQDAKVDRLAEPIFAIAALAGRIQALRH
jgi:hypothetical protein